jgi:phage tail-like protein
MNLDLSNFDTAVAYSFLVKIDGIQMPQVMEVTGLKMSVGKIEIKQQTDAGLYKITNVPGRPESGQFTIKRGVTDSKTITDWLKQVMEGDVQGARKTATVEVLDYKGTTIKSYEFRNVMVTSVEMDPLKAGGTDTLTEKITCIYEESEVK